MRNILLPIIAVAIIWVVSAIGCTPIEAEFMKVSQDLDKRNKEIQDDTIEWQYKFAPILADSSKYMFAGAYVNTQSYTQFLVAHMDVLITDFEKLNPKDYRTPTDIMITKRKGEELANKIEFYREQVFTMPIWNEQDVAYLEDSLPLNTYYDMDNARKLKKKDWAAYHFDHVPSIGVVTLLKKFKNNALKSQSIVWGRIYEKAMSLEK